MAPRTKYARNGDLSIAYQVVGDGPIDLVHGSGSISHVEYVWEEPHFARFLRRLAAFSRLILFDKRGTGLSDRSAGIASMEERMDDVRAVMDTAGAERGARCLPHDRHDVHAPRVAGCLPVTIAHRSRLTLGRTVHNAEMVMGAQGCAERPLGNATH